MGDHLAIHGPFSGRGQQIWDYESEDVDQRITVIRHGDTEIWREPSVWEGYKRFGEIVEILKEKYGEHLVDVEPTPASEQYLFGDRLSSPEFVEAIRKSLKTGTSQG